MILNSYKFLSESMGFLFLDALKIKTMHYHLFNGMKEPYNVFVIKKPEMDFMTYAQMILPEFGLLFPKAFFDFSTFFGKGLMH
jgi:hypothetical protein